LKTGDSPSFLSTYISSTCEAILGFVGFRWVILGSDGYSLATVIIVGSSLPLSSPLNAT
jgi:hypothetical protein